MNKEKQPTNEALFERAINDAKTAYPNAMPAEIEQRAHFQYEHDFVKLGLEGDPYKKCIDDVMDAFFENKWKALAKPNGHMTAY